MKEREKKAIMELSNAFGPSGREEEVMHCAAAILKEALPAGSFCLKTDSINNLFIQLLPIRSKPVILLDAHMDEVGFMVKDIQENGTLHFLPLGGQRPVNAVGTGVVIQNTQGHKIHSLIGAAGSHAMGSQQDAWDFDDLFIDPGTSNAQQSQLLGLAPGDFAVPDVRCRWLEGRDLFLGKAFDDRIGCAALLETLIQCHDKALAVTPEGLLSAQEEVGERGMACALSHLEQKPALAICFEGCPADDIYTSHTQSQSALRQGPMVRCFDRSMITSPRFLHFVRHVATEAGIPVQYAVRKAGGTNGGMLHLQDIPTIVIGIPVRYTHAGPAYVCAQDYENAVRLAMALLEHLDEATIEQIRQVPADTL